MKKPNKEDMTYFVISCYSRVDTTADGKNF
jgi:hypothetical protein